MLDEQVGVEARDHENHRNVHVWVEADREWPNHRPDQVEGQRDRPSQIDGSLILVYPLLLSFCIIKL